MRGLFGVMPRTKRYISLRASAKEPRMLTRSPDPHHIADAILNSDRLILSNLPADQHGLYGLFDHRGLIRYVGVTACRGGFRDRIYNKHVTGSIHGRRGTDGRSHKFASEYIPQMDRESARHFARKHCGAAIFPVPGRPPLSARRTDPSLQAYEAKLRGIETNVVATLRARGFALDWNI
jgi:hypothetical protein